MRNIDTKTIQVTDTQDTAGEARTSSSVMYSYGPPHMAKQKQDDQLEHTYSSYVRIREVDLKTSQKRWMIGRSGEIGSGISVLAARHDDDDWYTSLCEEIYLFSHFVTYPWYTDMWNRHRESKNTKLYKIGSGTKLYYLWVKGFSTWGERDTQSFYADCFYIVSSQPNQFAAPIAHKFVWRRHPNTLVSIPIWDFYFDISEWHILSARAWTPALMLHLTNPCAKRKVLSLTKPKGKLY